MKQLDLVQVKQIFNRLFDHMIETRGVRYCELNEDYYWHVSSPERYNVAETPELDIGSLYDDWDFVSGILDSDDSPVAYQLTELAPIIRYIGEEIGTKQAQYGG